MTINPYYIIESALDDEDDASVYDDNFSGMYDFDESVNPAMDGIYKQTLIFVLTAIPKKVKENYNSLIEWLDILDEYLRDQFANKGSILQTFDHIRYKMFMPDKKEEYKENHMIIVPYTSGKLDNIQVMIPCNFRKSARAINSIIYFAFKTLQRFGEACLKVGGKFPTVSYIRLKDNFPKKDETPDNKKKNVDIAEMSNITYRNNNEKSIKQSLYKFYKIVLGEINSEAVNKYFDNKTPMDYIRTLLDVVLNKQAAAKAEIIQEPDKYIIKINSRSIPIPFIKYKKKYYIDICKALGKRIIWDVSETIVNIDWYREEDCKILFQNCVDDVYKVVLDIGKYKRSDIRPYDFGNVHIKQLVVNTSESNKQYIKLININNIDNIHYVIIEEN